MTNRLERIGMAVALGIAGGAGFLGGLATTGSKTRATSAFEQRLLDMPENHVLVSGSRHLEVVDGDILATSSLNSSGRPQEIYAGSVILVDCVAKPRTGSYDNMAWYHITGPSQFSGDYTDAYNTNPALPIGITNTPEPKYVDSSVPNCPAH